MGLSENIDIPIHRAQLLKQDNHYNVYNFVDYF
jgi:hypothetical protein